MPLPWKKNNRVSSLSRLVEGLHHSPKHGGSLVVETGFPTSLVDLFVKNKYRLKKPSKKRSPPYSPLQTTRSPPPPPPSPSPWPVQPDGLEANLASGFAAAKLNVDDLVVVNECDGGGDGYVMFEKRVFGVFLKILMVVVVALSTKTMAVGITMSAFLLFLVEYAARSGALVFLKPCSEARRVLDPFLVMVKVLYFPNYISKKEIDDVNDEIQRCNEDSSKGQLIIRSDVSDSFEFGLKSPGREIQVADSNCDGEQCDALVCRKERSRNAKIIRKFVKKFVPKKLRDAKKEWKNREREKEREKEKEEEKEKEKENVSKSNSETGLSCLADEKLQKISDQEQDNVFGNCQAEVGKVEEIVKRERKVNSGYSWILLFIVLGGLLGGRILAFLCTIGWCLMLKLVTPARRISDV